MSLRLRQIIFILLVLIFIAVVPAIIFYTAGYKYNFNKNKMEKTGSLVLDSLPAKARILLNGYDAHKITPTAFSHLLPDDYRIRLEKTGYYPWEKTLAVLSNRTTFATDVVFFRESSPEIPFDQKIKSVVLSPDGAFAAFVASSEKQEELLIWNFRDERSVRFSTAGKIDELAWSPSGKFILVKTGNSRFFVVHKEVGQALDIYKLTGREWQNIVWSETNDEDLYGSTPAGGGAYGIYKIDPNNLKTQKISSGGSKVWQQNSRLYTILPSKNGTKFLEISAAEKPKEIAILKFGDYSFLPSRPDIVMLADKNKPLLYLLKPELNNPVLLETRASLAVWSPSFKKLVLSDDFELHLYDYEKNEISFITRHGEPVKKALWLAGEAHLLIEFADSIMGLELDSRDKRYSPTLASGKDISDIFLADKTKTAYFTALTAKGRRLFKLLIQ